MTMLRHYLRRSWLLGCAASVATFSFMMIACRVFAQIQERSSEAAASIFTQFMPQWVQSAFGVGPETMTQLNGFMAVCLQHPFLLTVLLALPVTLLTAWLSGDVENRSLALVISRPVSRLAVATSASAVAVFWSALAIGAACTGCILGARYMGYSNDLNTQQLLRATLALGALVFAFTGIAAAISASMSVRADAVGWCLTIVLGMYVWNFLAQVWYAGGGRTNYSLFHFYRPTEILLRGQFDPGGPLILGTIGAAGFLVCWVTFRLRSFSI